MPSNRLFQGQQNNISEYRLCQNIVFGFNERTPNNDFSKKYAHLKWAIKELRF